MDFLIYFCLSCPSWSFLFPPKLSWAGLMLHNIHCASKAAFRCVQHKCKEEIRFVWQLVDKVGKLNALLYGCKMCVMPILDTGTQHNIGAPSLLGVPTCSVICLQILLQVWCAHKARHVRQPT